MYLGFVIFFSTLAVVATQTNGLVNCQTGSLRYPFGFTDGYPIRFNCSKITGDVEVGEFAVDEVTNDSVYVKIPPVCTREIWKIEQLFQENLAPSNLQNIILVNGCNKSSSSCSINPKFLQVGLNSTSCVSSVTCIEGSTTVDADVMSIRDVLNPNGCRYWRSSITKSSADSKSGIALDMGRIKLDWWIKEGCSNTTCSENANCTVVKLPDGGLGHRCTCRDGFSGDAFSVHGGCRSETGADSSPFLSYLGIVFASIMVVIIVAGSMFCFISRRRETLDVEQREENLIDMRRVLCTIGVK